MKEKNIKKELPGQSGKSEMCVDSVSVSNKNTEKGCGEEIKPGTLDDEVRMVNPDVNTLDRG